MQKQNLIAQVNDQLKGYIVSPPKGTSSSNSFSFASTDTLKSKVITTRFIRSDIEDKVSHHELMNNVDSLLNGIDFIVPVSKEKPEKKLSVRQRPIIHI